jgi:hypothetical protein
MGGERLAFVNGLLEKAWRRGWANRPQLDPAALMEAARRAAATDDFGPDDGWCDRLDRLCVALNDEAALTALGRTIAYGQVVAALGNRARTAALWRRTPEIADVSVPAPIIIVGQMRSGSTRMQRLLACDTRFTFTRFFESWNPVPRWNWLPMDDRRLRGRLALRVAHALNPNFGVIHPVRARQADEEIGLHNVSLFGAAFEAQWRIPSFARHGENMDSRPVYAEFKRHLQTIKWLRKNREEKPWILKLPQFSQDLGAVLDTFPDARVVVLHRHPVAVVGSSASLVHNQMVVQSDCVDPVWIGQEWLRKVGLRQRRTAEALRVKDVPRVEVAFSAMQADWRGEMVKVYKLLNCSFDKEAEQRMARFLESPKHAKLSRHRYDIMDFGLTEDLIRNSLEDREPLAAA